MPLLLGITVILSAVIGAFAFGLPMPTMERPVLLSVSATADDGRIEVVHEGGPSIDLRDVTMRIEVDGTPLEHQPPIPFFSATGFVPGPTGPFNSATDPVFEIGERASLSVAGTNSPSMASGVTLTVELFRDEARIAMAETRVR